MNFKVRRATLGDLKTIQKFNHDLFLHDYKYDRALDNNWTFSKDGDRYFRKAITNKRYLTLVSTKKDDTVGYLIGYLWNRWNYRPVKTAELDNMLVVGSARGRSIGSALVSEFIKWCKKRGAKSVLVMAYQGNEEAIRFYRQNQFDDLSVRLERKLS